jgi:hypothetical protein
MMAASYTHFDFAKLAPYDRYKLLCGVVVPRPIALIINADTWESATVSAALGGTTTVLAFAAQHAGIDPAEARVEDEACLMFSSPRGHIRRSSVCTQKITA